MLLDTKPEWPPEHRSGPFMHRQMLYAQLDEEFAAHTRFFAAAALTNSVLARLFLWLPRNSLLHGYQFLRDAGAVLEVVNLKCATDIRHRTTSETSLDQFLILREQRAVQSLLDEHEARKGQGISLYKELNGLLNGSHVRSLIVHMFADTRHYNGILKKLRRKVGLALDFANESHRIHIGLGIISAIRENDEHRGCNKQMNAR